MMEFYPVFRDGRAQSYVRTFGDYFEVFNGSSSEHYLWSGESGFKVVNKGSFFTMVYEDYLNPSFEFREESIEKRLLEAEKSLRNILDGKLVMADLSGGKDSTAQLILLTQLQEKINFKLVAVYVHVPYLEPLENISFVERVATRLGVELEVIEADRKMVEFYLLREGLPKRGVRWCTYLKSKALRLECKRLGADFEAKGDRMLESGKRMNKLRDWASNSSFIKGKTLNLVYDFSAFETANIVKREGLIHPHYLQGIPRISCRFCPYRGLYELAASSNQEVEDIGLIEFAGRRSYEKYFSGITSWDLFWELALWRYPPSIARMRLREIRNIDYTKSIPLIRAREMFRSMWLY
ncbi:MAG: phosphoadenosine phosphosulfate reductase family protein [Infirmifilum sp.]